MDIPKDPILFIKPRTALAGPGELSVSKAAQDDQLDFETELALVIGKDALDVSEEEALDYVLGLARTAFGLLIESRADSLCFPLVTVIPLPMTSRSGSFSFPIPSGKSTTKSRCPGCSSKLTGASARVSTSRAPSVLS
jgi:hypothetical protein